VYVQDAWKVNTRFTANIGLRWKRFGVQHNTNPMLDSNFDNPANQSDTPLARKPVCGGIRRGRIVDDLHPGVQGLYRNKYGSSKLAVGGSLDGITSGSGRLPRLHIPDSV
jgi:hypothetical protein